MQPTILDKKFWLDSSDRLAYEGKAPQLSATRAARMPAFFEHASTNLPNTLNLLETKGLQTSAILNEMDEIFPPVIFQHRLMISLRLCIVHTGWVEWIQQQMENEMCLGQPKQPT